MTIRTRLFIAFFLLSGMGFYYLTTWIQDELRPRYLEAMEESMVDMAAFLASQLEQELEAERINTENLEKVFERVEKRNFSATIYDVVKTESNMNVYVTDQQGIVLFDSAKPENVGVDFHNWNDVYRTLRGEYGARSTRSRKSDPTSSVLHVAAPIYKDNTIIGVLTVSKPVDSVTLFLAAADRRVVTAGIIATFMVVILGLLLSFWITKPIAKLTQYALAVRDGKRVSLPNLGKNEIASLGKAFDEMRDALEKKNYVEEYVQSLTHEIKSPLSAIQGAVELLGEDMEESQREQFLNNLRTESERIQDLVDRMLQLTALESRNQLHDVESVDPAALCTEVIQSMKPIISARNLQVNLLDAPKCSIQGERFLIRQALSNLLQNAIDFSTPGDTIEIEYTQSDVATVALNLKDQGTRIPEYAVDKIYERFYSLSRPDTGKKSTGLGLAFVREVAELHGGNIDLETRHGGGTIARLSLPKHQ